MTSAPELTVIEVPVSDARVEPLLRELGHEYSTRYGKDAHAEISRYPDEEFTEPRARGEFEVTGARATASAEGLDRFWRNVRTHTLHDPVAYKRREIGRHVLTGELPQPSWYS